jgi:hypothetical protein
MEEVKHPLILTSINPTIKKNKLEKNYEKAGGCLKCLVASACIFTGLLAGENLDRYIIQVPAWHHLNILNWLEYTRRADLGNGLLFYPLEAITGFILLLTSSVIVVIDRNVFKHAAFPVYTATLLAAIGLILTFFAAPILLSLRTMGNNPVLAQEAFDRFHFFGLFRAIAQVLSFFVCVWALGKLSVPFITSNIKNYGNRNYYHWYKSKKLYRTRPYNCDSFRITGVTVLYGCKGNERQGEENEMSSV